MSLRSTLFRLRQPLLGITACNLVKGQPRDLRHGEFHTALPTATHFNLYKMQQEVASNRFGVCLNESDDDSNASGFFFTGGWSGLNSRKWDMGSPESTSPASTILKLVNAKVRVPYRPKTPVGGRSNNTTPDSERDVPRPSSRSGSRPVPVPVFQSRQQALYHDERRPSSGHITPELPKMKLPSPGSAPLPMTKYERSRSSSRSSVSSALSNKPLLDSSPIRRSSSVNGLNFAFVSKLSACAAACNRPSLPAQAAAANGSESSGCFSNGCVPRSTQQSSEGLINFFEKMPKLWVDKHRPESLASFVINAQQAQHLRHLISGGNCHHLLFQGPGGSGKKTLIMALLRDIFGSAAWQARSVTRAFEFEGNKLSLPVTVSAHHVEVNLSNVGSYLRPVLSTIIKEIELTCKRNDNDYDMSGVMDYRVLVLHDADKVTVEAQQHIRWLMDRYADYCKIIVCCQQPSKIADSIRSRCVIVDVQSPTLEDVVQVLQFVAKREHLELSDVLARRIAKLSRNNIRQAVLSMEACSLNQYPFTDDQTIVTGWDHHIGSMARDIINEQTPKRLYNVREKIQRLLDDGVAPKLIHWRLVQELVGLVSAPLQEEVYQWARFYARKLPDGPDAVFKLEEFVAKLMSIYKKASVSSS